MDPTTVALIVAVVGVLSRIADHKITHIDEFLPWCYART
jgi:hypothetical protein